MKDSSPISAEQFRDAMSLVPGFVTVIATEEAGKRFGYTATAVCSLSAEPPQIIVCANKELGNHEAIQQSGRFSINVLSEQQVEISTRFSSPPVEDRFEVGDWQVGESGMPVLADAVATFECVLEQHIDCATHSVLIGLIVACNTDPKSVLMYGNRSYGRFTPLDAG